MSADIMAEVVRAAKKLAAAAPPLSSEQALMLISVFSRYPAGGNTTDHGAEFARPGQDAMAHSHAVGGETS